MSKKAVALCGAAALAFGMNGCAATYEGSGSKDAATAEQLAQHQDDQWDAPVTQKRAQAEGTYRDGVYTGKALGVGGPVSVTLLLQGNHITCLETVQEGETQSVGGYEAIRDGKYAELIEAAQGSDIDVVAGATLTTKAVSEAVDEALDQASVPSTAQASGVS